MTFNFKTIDFLIWDMKAVMSSGRWGVAGIFLLIGLTRKLASYSRIVSGSFDLPLKLFIGL